MRRRRFTAIVVLALLLTAGLGVARLFGDDGGGASASTTDALTTTGVTTTTGTRADDLPTQQAQRAAVRKLVDLGYPIYCGAGTKKLVALTFDDGPGPYTPLALKHLRRDDLRATFFVSGSTLATYGSLVKAEAKLAALGNHSWSHVDLTTRSAAEVRAQLARTKRAVERLTGVEMLVFRPPYGAFDDTVTRRAAELGMATVIWSVASGDSDGLTWTQIGAAVGAGLEPGAIVLMHENRGQTIRALRRLILPALRRSGLRAVTVPELLALDPPTEAQLRRGAQGC